MPEKQTSPPEDGFALRPFHVLLLGAGILGSGVMLTASVSYRQAGKQLAAEGIDANIRRRILPHAVRALTASLLMTGAAAAGGFYVLQSLGFVSSEAPANAATLRTAWEMIGRPIQQQQQQQQRESTAAHQQSQQSRVSSNS